MTNEPRSWSPAQSAWITKRSPRSRGSQALKALLVFALFIALSVILTGCQTGAVIRDVPLSYNAIKTVVTANLPQGLKKESPNGRELTSGYFAVDTFAPEKPDMNIRAYAVVTILGSSRPYNVDVKVIREAKKKGFYRSEGRHDEMTLALGERLKQALADRREDRNIIDDFRAF